MNTRDIFKQNLNYYIVASGKSKKLISEEMNIPYTTLVDWANGNKFPRADGIEKLSDYFKILKSNLLEENKSDNPIDEKQLDEEIIKRLCALNDEDLARVDAYMQALLDKRNDTKE